MKFLLAAQLLFLSALLPGQVFLSEQEAARMVLGKCASIEREEKSLSADDRLELKGLAGLRFPIPRYTFLVCRQKEAAARYAVVMNEIGKSEPITFMVGVDSSGKAGKVALMVFRESRGSEVREPRFTRQFHGKTLDDPIHINQDIMVYTGATLSSEAITHGVKKALALVRHFYLKK